MENSKTIFIAGVFGVIGVLLGYFGMSADCAYDRTAPTFYNVTYDHNGDGAVDLIDMSIAIDNLQKTVETAQSNIGQLPYEAQTSVPLPYVYTPEK